METRKIKITDPNGLHLREAAKVVRLCKKYQSKVYLCHKCKVADTCSILEVLGLAATKDVEVDIIVEGPDEKIAVKEIAEFFNEGAGI